MRSSSRAQLLGDDRETRDVSARPRERRDETARDRIGHVDEDDRDRRRGPSGGLSGGRALGHDDVDAETDDFDSQIREPAELLVRVPMLDRDVQAFHVPELSQTS